MRHGRRRRGSVTTLIGIQIDVRLVPALAADRRDVDTVSSEALAGSDADTVYATYRGVGRVLIMLDLNFSNPFRFPPEDTERIVVVRLPRPILPANLPK